MCPWTWSGSLAVDPPRTGSCKHSSSFRRRWCDTPGGAQAGRARGWRRGRGRRAGWQRYQGQAAQRGSQRRRLPTTAMPPAPLRMHRTPALWMHRPRHSHAPPRATWPGPIGADLCRASRLAVRRRFLPLQGANAENLAEYARIGRRPQSKVQAEVRQQHDSKAAAESPMHLAAGRGDRHARAQRQRCSGFIVS